VENGSSVSTSPSAGMSSSSHGVINRASYGLVTGVVAGIMEDSVQALAVPALQQAFPIDTENAQLAASVATQIAAGAVAASMNRQLAAASARMMPSLSRIAMSDGFVGAGLTMAVTALGVIAGRQAGRWISRALGWSQAQPAVEQYANHHPEVAASPLDECVICMEDRHDCLFLPCRHVSVCLKCYHAQKDTLKTCPTCRSAVDNVVHILFP